MISRTTLEKNERGMILNEEGGIMENQSMLNQFILSGKIWIEGGVYYGRASDGVMVRIGWEDEKEEAERYLRDHPSPMDW